MFSATFRYALISLLEIASSEEGVNASELARRHQISLAYLSNVLSDLKRLGLIKSQKGRRGGYQLMKSPGEIDLLQLQQGLAGSPPPLTGSSTNPALLWLDGLELRWQQELAATTLLMVQAQAAAAGPP